MTNILRRRSKPALTYAIVALLLVCASAPAAIADKLTAEEVVAKHLASLGPAPSRNSGRSRVAVGSARAVFKARSTSGGIDGRIVFGSVENKAMVAMAFNAPNYPGEKWGFDGKKVTVAYQTPGIRSTLGNLLVMKNGLVKEGLMGGTLSSAWPLLDLSASGGKVEYSGTDKVDGRLAHKLSYTPKHFTDLQVNMYFDAETFQHVRTQYEMVISARLAAGGVDNQASQRETRYKMVENFSEYKKEGELILPHRYTLELAISKFNGSSQDKWEIALEQFAFNQQIEPNSFNVEGN